DRELIAEAVKGADMVFITAGMGGGTGTGASAVVAEVAREQGILTAAVVTKPFLFEGNKRSKNADQGIKELRKHVDCIITIHNNRLLDITEKDTPWLQALNLANDVLRQAVKGISDLILVPGLINQDFADIKTILSNSGRALMGVGYATGENRAVEAAKMAIKSPLLEETSIENARGLLINISGGASLGFHEVNEAASLIQDAVHEDAEIIFGSVIDSDLEDRIVITVIATGFEDKNQASVSAYEKWRPAVDSRSSADITMPEDLQKNIGEAEYLDVPTFMRKNRINMDREQTV
ncbi:cell division protein FtsZ, partial [bacterium]|nr:cell division protein FtsZ [bacterium]